jgi:hypothetical protein
MRPATRGDREPPASREFAARAPKTYAALIVGFLIFIVTTLVLAANGKQLFPGWPLVWTFGVFGAGVIIYYLFLYRGAFKLRVEIAKEKKRLDADQQRNT